MSNSHIFYIFRFLKTVCKVNFCFQNFASIVVLGQKKKNNTNNVTSHGSLMMTYRAAGFCQKGKFWSISNFMSALSIFLCSLFWGRSTDNPSPTLASLGFVLHIYRSYVRAVIPDSETLPLQGNHKEGMVLTSAVAPPYQQSKTKWEMRNRKAPFASLAEPLELCRGI